MRHWKLITGVVVVFVLVVGAAAAAFALSNSLGETAAGDIQPGPAASPAVHIVLRDNAFEPTSVDVAAGSPVEIELQNAGAVNHNFTSNALDVSTGPMKPGDVTTATVTLPHGTYQFVCTWHQGMTIDVVAK
jgi:plastocyanin